MLPTIIVALFLLFLSLLKKNRKLLREKETEDSLLRDGWAKTWHFKSVYSKLEFKDKSLEEALRIQNTFFSLSRDERKEAIKLLTNSQESISIYED